MTEVKINARQRYYLKNKEKMDQTSKKYYENHKEEMNAKYREIIMCNVCHKILSRRSKSRHIKSKKHILAKDRKEEVPKIKIESCEKR